MIISVNNSELYCVCVSQIIEEDRLVLNLNCLFCLFFFKNILSEWMPTGRQYLY